MHFLVPLRSSTCLHIGHTFLFSERFLSTSIALYELLLTSLFLLSALLSKPQRSDLAFSFDIPLRLYLRCSLSPALPLYFCLSTISPSAACAAIAALFSCNLRVLPCVKYWVWRYSRVSPAFAMAHSGIPSFLIWYQELWRGVSRMLSSAAVISQKSLKSISVFCKLCLKCIVPP